jgi:hypothetical protein
MEDNLKKEIEELLSSFRETVAEEHAHYKAMVEAYILMQQGAIIEKALKDEGIIGEDEC